MRRHKVTYNIPEEVLTELNLFVSQRKRSKFVAEAIQFALELERKKLEQAYIEAAKNEERNAEIGEWDTTEIEGWNE